MLKAYREAHVRRGPLLRLGAIRERAEGLIHRYDVKAAGPQVPARQLSGGNLQKVVLGREFLGEPLVLVAASPTRGLDVAATDAVHRYLREGAAEGMGILLIGEDLDEILALADRIVVMYEGRLVGELDAVDRDARGGRAADGRRHVSFPLRIERRLRQPWWLSAAVPARLARRRVLRDRARARSRRTIRWGTRSRGCSRPRSAAAARSSRRSSRRRRSRSPASARRSRSA